MGGRIAVDPGIRSMDDKLLLRVEKDGIGD